MRKYGVCYDWLHDGNWMYGGITDGFSSLAAAKAFINSMVNAGESIKVHEIFSYWDD